MTYTLKYNKLYEYLIYAIIDGSVSETVPNWGGENKEFAVSTRANIQQSNKYRVTLSGVDFGTHDNISFSFMVNYDGITFSTVDGTVFLTAVDGASYQLVVDKDDKVYINGMLLDGITMDDGVVAFDITRNPDTDIYAFFEATDVKYDVEIKTEFMSQLKDIYVANHKNATKTVTPATSAEKISMGITQFTTYTSTGWRQNAFDSFDLTLYNTVKFYVQRINGGKLVIDGKDYASTDGSFAEIKFVKNGTAYDLYVNGEKIELTNPITNLNQILFNINQGSFKYSDILVDSDSYIAPTPLTAVTGTIFTGATVVASPESTPDMDDKTGLEIYQDVIVNGKYGNISLIDKDLMEYTEVKFYVKRVSGTAGDIRANSNGGSEGRFVDMSDNAWHEFHLVKNSEGTGFDVYVDGVLSSVLFHTDSNRTTECELTNLKQFARNAYADGEVWFSNLFVYTDPNAHIHSYTGNPVWSNVGNVYTATYACDDGECNVAKTVNITVPTVEGVDAIVQVEDNSAFKFTITPKADYEIVSVQIGNQDLDVTAGVYSTAIAQGTINIVMVSTNNSAPVALTIGSNGALSGEGVTGQTITLPTSKVWNLNEANAKTITVSLSDATATASSLTINGVAITGTNQIVINSVPYLVGAVDMSTAGQVSFKIAFIQDTLYLGNGATYSGSNGVVHAVALNSDGTEDTKIASQKGNNLTQINNKDVDTTEAGITYDQYNVEKNSSGEGCFDWRLYTTKAAGSVSFYVGSNQSITIYAKGTIGTSGAKSYTLEGNKAHLITILADGSVLVNGVDTGIDTTKGESVKDGNGGTVEGFCLDMKFGGAYASFYISKVYWRYNIV